MDRVMMQPPAPRRIPRKPVGARFNPVVLSKIVLPSSAPIVRSHGQKRSREERGSDVRGLSRAHVPSPSSSSYVSSSPSVPFPPSNPSAFSKVLPREHPPRKDARPSDPRPVHRSEEPVWRTTVVPPPPLVHSEPRHEHVQPPMESWQIVPPLPTPPPIPFGGPPLAGFVGQPFFMSSMPAPQPLSLVSPPWTLPPSFSPQPWTAPSLFAQEPAIVEEPPPGPSLSWRDLVVCSACNAFVASLDTHACPKAAKLDIGQLENALASFFKTL
jgi:hypothetical protein